VSSREAHDTEAARDVRPADEARSLSQRAAAAPVPAVERGLRLAQAARAGDRRALGRLLTELEDRTPAAEAALRVLHPLAGQAHLVGVTGAPGSGKSTLVAALVRATRSSGRTVAVVAVDPSSPITGGTIMGDRIRMQEHASDPGVFIRSMASRGHAGGLAAAAVGAAAVLDACGYALVFLETVGTGQGEVEVAAAADTTLVVQAPGMGDEVQAIKAGLLEVADLVAVTKADRPEAGSTASGLRAMLTVGAGADRARGDRPQPRRPQVLLVSALTGEGVDELLAAIDRRAPGDGGRGEGSARLARARAQVEAIIVERLRARLAGEAAAREVEAVIAAVADHELDPYAAADQLLTTIGELE
jgi:LAO/AO transport system kinase